MSHDKNKKSRIPISADSHRYGENKLRHIKVEVKYNEVIRFQNLLSSKSF